MSRCRRWVVVALAVVACSPSLQEPVDAGVVVVVADAGTTVIDAGPAVIDAGPAVIDAGRLDAGAADSGCPGPSGVGEQFTLRAVAANLTSGNAQSYDPGEGRRVLQGLRPDVVMIQELRIGTNSAADVDAFANSLSDGGMHAVRGSIGYLPNGILSRWPILESGDWVDPKVDNRGFTWAKLDLPGERDLWVVSLHLLTSNATERNQEASALVAQLQTKVPAGDFLLIGGDLNTNSRTEAALSTLGSRVVTAGPHPVDQNGEDGTNASRSKPYDWVMASRCLGDNQVAVVIGARSFESGFVADTAVYTPITDLAPALASDSSAVNMQHMAVVKDFVIAP